MGVLAAIIVILSITVMVQLEMMGKLIIERNRLLKERLEFEKEKNLLLSKCQKIINDNNELIMVDSVVFVRFDFKERNLN